MVCINITFSLVMRKLERQKEGEQQNEIYEQCKQITRKRTQRAFHVNVCRRVLSLQNDMLIMRTFNNLYNTYTQVPAYEKIYLIQFNLNNSLTFIFIFLYACNRYFGKVGDCRSSFQFIISRSEK